MMWTQEFILEFIELYRTKEVLWNQKNPQYYNKNRKNDAWEDIAFKLKINIEECKKKMCSLLSSMRREKMKIRKSQMLASSSKDIYESCWFAFPNLKFLWSREQGESADESNSTLEQEEKEFLNFEEDYDDENLDTPSTPPPPPSKKRRSEIIKSERLEPLYNSLGGCSSKSVDDDECDIFGKFIGKKLQKYPPLIRSQVQQAIMNIIFNADGEHFSENPDPLSNT